jgi:6-phosphogluconate dehydrogenase
MVHNGIEYIDMQLIAETYWIMKMGLGMKNDEIAAQFEKWNKGRSDSYLIEITAKILLAKYADGTFVVDSILDSAGSKGTGKWTSEEILEFGTVGFGFVSAVIARFASAQKKERIKLSKEFPKNSPSKMAIGMEQLENALYVSKILAYAQGYELLNAASKKYAWNLNFQEISRIWEGGCIIRASFLKELEEAFAKDNNGSILTSLVFKKSIENGTSDLRLIASAAIMNSLPVPAFLSGIAYFDSMTNEFLCANMIQAQRDFFGAHTFQKEVDGDFFHHDWD